jgi:hypothetical protein
MEMEKKVDDKRLSSVLNSIQIALDGYDDIFSDFDPSPYSQRILSDDFIKEIQKRYIETKKGDFEVRFSLPDKLRDQKTESLIKKRLKEYFTAQLKEMENEIERKKQSGMIKFAIGFLLLAGEVINRFYTKNDIVFDILSVLLVPAGWYGMFSGLESFFDLPQRTHDQRRFMRKFRDAIYLFVSEETVVKHIESTSDQKPLEVFMQDES